MRIMKLVRKPIIQTISDGPGTLLRSSGGYIDYKLCRSSPRYVRAKRSISGQLNGYTAVPDPLQKLDVPVQEINLYRSRGYSSVEEYWESGGYWQADNKHKFNKWSDLGAIYDGEWDTQILDLTKLPKYVGMEEHFLYNVPWEETSLFDYYRTLLNKEITVDGCTSETELLERYRKIEQMCHNMRTEGYKSREEVCDEDDFQCLMDEVTVNIGRNGQFIFGDGGGWHRLSAAKIFDIDVIPVRVLVRHTEWQKIRERIHTSTESELEDDLRPYLNHPDMDM